MYVSQAPERLAIIHMARLRVALEFLTNRSTESFTISSKLPGVSQENALEPGS